MGVRHLLEAIVPVSVFIFTLVGCTSLEESASADTESLLSASGFTVKLADTPAKKEQIEKLPQRKIAHLKRDGKLVFVYADSKYCKCMYVGSESEYQNLQKLRVETDIAAEESIAAESADFGWGAWD